MKYFTYELIAAANDWIDQTNQELRVAEKRLNSAIQKYQRELESLKPRISGAAWNFFRHGFGEQQALQLGFLFASGATVVFEFQRLVFRKRRIKRGYEPGEIYR